MIVKDRKIPLKIRKLEALLRRLHHSHPKYSEVEEELAKSLAGFKGEQSLDYYLRSLPDQEYFIFHDLRLSDGAYFFQIDTLILSTSFILILEVKNISGTLIFDPAFQQLIRTNNGMEEVFSDPIQQVNYQTFKFTEWLKNKHFPAIPIEPLVVMANSNTIIKTSLHHKLPLQSVIRSTKLLEKIYEYKESHKEEKFSKKDIRKLCNLLLTWHVPKNFDVLQRFQINRSDLLMGVHCPKCKKLSMERKWGKWVCTTCSFSSRDAHKNALNDYFLLFQSSITNEQFRNFLQLPSSSIAYKLLTSMNLPHSGTKRWREYDLFLDESIE